MRNRRIAKIARLWALWNAKEITADEFAMKVGNLKTGIIALECRGAWRAFTKNQLFLMTHEDPLVALLI